MYNTAHSSPSHQAAFAAFPLRESSFLAPCRKLDGPQNQDARFENENLLPLIELKTRLLGRPVRNIVITPPELSPFSNHVIFE